MSVTDLPVEAEQPRAQANGTPGPEVEDTPAKPDPLETALRQVLPDEYTCWTTQSLGGLLSKTATDKLSEALSKRFGGDAEVSVEVLGLGGKQVAYKRAAWANPAGLWSIAFCQGHHDEPVYDVSIDAPDIDITQRKVTVDHALSLLRSLGAIA